MAMTWTHSESAADLAARLHSAECPKCGLAGPFVQLDGSGSTLMCPECRFVFITGSTHDMRPSDSHLSAQGTTDRLPLARVTTRPHAVSANVSTPLESSAPVVSAPSRSDIIPKKIGGYHVLSVIGRGSMGTVYLALSRELERYVAIKVVGSLADTKIVSRFLTEAKAIAALSHPNIVKVFQAGEDDIAGHYLVMEFIDGVSLAELMALGQPDSPAPGEQRPVSDVVEKAQERKRTGIVPPKPDSFRMSGKHAAPSKPVRMPLNIVQSVRIIEQTAVALDHAHRRGVIHRDLKPANVMVTSDGRPVVTDFGLARIVAKKQRHGAPNAVRLTLHGEVLGTPAYMSPEQALGQNDEVDERSDVYALGAILYEMLCGRSVIPRNIDAFKALRYVVNREPKRLRAINPKVPRDLETICLKCLDKEPDRRYPSAIALAEDLRRFINGWPVVARRASVAYRIRKHMARHKLFYSMILFSLLFVVASFGYSLRQKRKADAEIEVRQAAYEAARMEKIVLENEKLRAEQAVRREMREKILARRELIRKKTTVWEKILDDDFSGSRIHILLHHDTAFNADGTGNDTFDGTLWKTTGRGWWVSDGQLIGQSDEGDMIYMPAGVDGDFELIVRLRFVAASNSENNVVSPRFTIILDGAGVDTPRHLEMTADHVTLTVGDVEIASGNAPAGLMNGGVRRMSISRRSGRITLRVSEREDSSGDDPSHWPLILNGADGERDILETDINRRIGFRMERGRVEIDRVTLLKPLSAVLTRPVAFADKLYRKRAWQLAHDEYFEAYLLALSEAAGAPNAGQHAQAMRDAAWALFRKGRCMERIAGEHGGMTSIREAILDYKKLLGEFSARDSDERITDLRARAMGRLSICFEELGMAEQAENVSATLFDPNAVSNPDAGIVELIDQKLARCRSGKLPESERLAAFSAAVTMAVKLNAAEILDERFRRLARTMVSLAVSRPEAVSQELETICDQVLKSGVGDRRVYVDFARAFRKLSRDDLAEKCAMTATDSCVP